MACKFRLNDKVVIITGKDKGKEGIIKKISLKNNRVLLDGLNLVFKHKKSIPSNNIVGGIYKKESWVNISNISHFCIISGEIFISRIGFMYIKNKKKRYLKYNNMIIK